MIDINARINVQCSVRFHWWNCFPKMMQRIKFNGTKMNKVLIRSLNTNGQAPKADSVVNSAGQPTPKVTNTIKIEDIKFESIESGDSRNQDILLDASLKYVPTHGFTTLSLLKGCQSLGWSAASHGMCTPFDLVE